MKLRQAITAIVALSVAGQTLGQGSSHAMHHQHGKAASAAPMMGMDMEKCMQDMQAADKKLDGLVTKMNSAHGADRIDATTAVVNQIVASHKEMMAMCHMMMGSMGKMHGGMGMMGGKAATHRHSTAGKGHEGHH